MIEKLAVSYASSFIDALWLCKATIRRPQFHPSPGVRGVGSVWPALPSGLSPAALGTSTISAQMLLQHRPFPVE